MFRFYKKPTNSSPTCGYFLCHEQFIAMHVIFAALTFQEAGLMEAILVESHRDKPGNRNVRPGGEGKQIGNGPFFTYITFKPA